MQRPSRFHQPLRAALVGAGLPLALLLAACGQQGSDPETSDPATPADAADASPARVAGGDAPEPRSPIAAPAPPAPTSGPRVAFEKLEHDFGKVSDIGTLKNRFPFRNEGDQRLTITEIKPSCGCTTTELAKKVYEPGEAGFIESEWEAKGFGQQKKTITVRTDGEPARTVLSISAEIDPFVSLVPSYLTFGQVRLGSEHTLRSVIRCADAKLEVLKVRSRNPHVLAQYVVEDDGTKAVLVRLLPSAPWGMLTTQIAIDVHGRPGGEGEAIEHHVDLGVNAQLFGDLELDRSMFAVGRVDPGASFDSAVELTHSDGEAFQVTELRIENATPSTMTVRSEPMANAAGSGYRLVVEGQAGGYLGLVRAQVVLKTDVESEPERRLSVMGMVRALEKHEH